MSKSLLARIGASIVLIALAACATAAPRLAAQAQSSAAPAAPVSDGLRGRSAD